MGIDQDIRRNDLGFQLRVLAGVPRILKPAAGAAIVEPGPAIESVFLNVGYIVGNQVVAQSVAFIG
jgi:hypothetical protein